MLANRRKCTSPSCQTGAAGFVLLLVLLIVVARGGRRAYFVRVLH